MKEMRPITYKNLAPAKAVYEAESENTRLINQLRGEVNALRNEVRGLSEKLGKINKAEHGE
jgi:hypothetical protein